MGDSSISSRFTPEKLALDLEWYNVRDMLIGQNCVTQDIMKAIELAADCRHPDAVHSVAEGLIPPKSVLQFKPYRSSMLRRSLVAVQLTCGLLLVFVARYRRTSVSRLES